MGTPFLTMKWVITSPPMMMNLPITMVHQLQHITKILTPTHLSSLDLAQSSWTLSTLTIMQRKGKRIYIIHFLQGGVVSEPLCTLVAPYISELFYALNVCLYHKGTEFFDTT
jgi:hypothetical protein